MVDDEVVRRRLREIDRRLRALRDIQGHGRDVFLQDQALQAQAERHLQLAIQSTLDIALHLVSEDTGETPENYGSSFDVLARAGIIDVELAQSLRLAAGLRKILVHDYLGIDPERVWFHLANLGDIESFASSVETYLPSA